MRDLGAKGPVAIVGYTFDGAWAARNRGAVERFLDATRQAKQILAVFGGRMAAAGAAHRRQRRRRRLRSTASATAKASCAARSPTKRRTHARFIACWPRSAAPNWSGRRASWRRHVLPTGGSGMNLALRLAFAHAAASQPGMRARRSPARACCPTRRRWRSRSSTRRARVRSPSISAPRWRASRWHSRSRWRSARRSGWRWAAPGSPTGSPIPG